MTIDKLAKKLLLGELYCNDCIHFTKILDKGSVVVLDCLLSGDRSIIEKSDKVKGCKLFEQKIVKIWQYKVERDVASNCEMLRVQFEDDTWIQRVIPVWEYSEEKLKQELRTCLAIKNI